MTTNNPVKILIIDDDEDDFIITGDYIKHIPGTEYQIDWCPQYEKALQLMKDKAYQLYFVDYRLGAKSDTDLLKDAQEIHCEEPIILLTGKGSYSVDMEAMQLGAVDYLIKPELSIEKMERSIRYALERAATLKALKANERKYRSIFERSKDIVFIANTALEILDINEAVKNVCGYTKDEMLHKNLADYLEHQDTNESLIQTLSQHKEVNDWEVVLKTKDGELKYCVLSATYEHSQKDNEVYVQGIMHDITNLKKVEKATLQAEKLAAAGRLVRTLAHEVRNPLNNISLSVEHLVQEVHDDETSLYLDMIARNSKRISNLITELLNTSKPSEIKMQRHPIQSVLDDVIAASIDRITLKKIDLKLDFPSEALYINADREKLSLALLNIIINATEAMEETKGNKLKLSVTPSNETAVLEIEDTGCGISEENISRLFEPYFTQKRNGMGLGLAFTLNILQAHKAGVDVTSVVGEGTKFTITFPLANVSAALQEA